MADEIASRAPRRWRLPCALAASLSVSALAAPPASAATVNVSVAGLAFSPASVTVDMTGGEPGAEAPHGHVVWTVADPGQEHTVTFDDSRLVSSGRLADGQRHEAIVYTPGTYTYRCTIHPAMTGTFVVAPAAATSPSSAVAANPPAGGAGLSASSESTGVVPVVVGVAVLAGVAGLVWLLLRRRRPATTD